jgi:RNA polymerase sigma factor (sigma-70 family)
MKSADINLDYLIQKAITGDRASLESLLLHFHDPLLKSIRARRLRHNISTIADEDVLQETLMEVLHRIGSLQPQGSEAFFAWLKVIARTRMINMVKAQLAQKRGGLLHQVQPAPSDATVTTLISHFAADQPTPSRIVRRKELKLVIATALANLNPNQRQIMELRYGQGLPVKEIGAQLGLGEGAVKMHINRSLKELRQVFSSHSTTWTNSM